ncbi:MAG: hypothetical protein KDB88_01980, partial [Flavobacteriales bacterium]|nr:hypothetical protein [Flavobacteriales bacterium]
MNTNKSAIMALIVLSAAACKKDDPEPPTTTTPTMATIRMGFEFLNGMNDYQLGEQLTDSAGNAMKFDKVRFYASNVELMDMDGNEMAHFHDTYMLAEVGGSNSWTLGDVDPGHIHMLRFNVGLDSLTNHQDPTLAEAPLNDATMHWGWNPAAGYKFIVIEGRV